MLAVCNLSSQGRQVGLGDGAPAGETVLTESDGHAVVGVDGEYPGSVTCTGTEVGSSRLGKHDGSLSVVTGEASENVAPIGQEDIAAFSSGPQTREEHETRWGGDAGALGVRIQLTAAQAGEPRTVGVDAGVKDGGEPVGRTVWVRRDGHQSGSEGQNRLTGRQAINRDQAGFAKLRGDRLIGAYDADIEVVGCEKRLGPCDDVAHRRTPSIEVCAARLVSHSERGKATDCRLGQIAQVEDALRPPCYVPKALAAHRMTRIAMTYTPPLWPVSVKGVALDAQDRVLLLKNEREEWELPGGRLEIGSADGSVLTDASPETALEREIEEETGWEVKTGPLLDGGVWIYEPIPGRRVLIVTYGCTVLTPERTPVVSHEHKQLGTFGADEVARLNMPEGYKRAVATWYRRETGSLGDYERM